MGVAGLKVPSEDVPKDMEVFRTEGGTDAGDEEVLLELGYHIFPEYRRQGYALECCEGIMEYGTRELGVSWFEARIARENATSRRLAEKLGFHQIALISERSQEKLLAIKEENAIYCIQ